MSSIHAFELPLTENPQLIGSSTEFAGHPQVTLRFTNFLTGLRPLFRKGKQGVAHPDWRTFLVFSPAGPIPGMDKLFEEALYSRPKVAEAKQRLKTATELLEKQRHSEDEHYAQFSEYTDMERRRRALVTEIETLKQIKQLGLQRRLRGPKEDELQTVLKQLQEFRAAHPGPRGNLNDLESARYRAERAFFQIREEEQNKNIQLSEPALNALLKTRGISLPAELSQRVRTGELTLFDLERQRMNFPTNNQGEALVGEGRDAVPCWERFLFPLDLIWKGISAECKNRLTVDGANEYFVFAPIADSAKANAGRNDLAGIDHVFVGNKRTGWAICVRVRLLAEIFLVYDNYRATGSLLNELMAYFPHPSHAKLPKPEAHAVEAPTTQDGAAPIALATDSVERIDPGQTAPPVSNDVGEGQAADDTTETPQITSRDAN